MSTNARRALGKYRQEVKTLEEAKALLERRLRQVNLKLQQRKQHIQEVIAEDREHKKMVRAYLEHRRTMPDYVESPH